MSNEIIDIIKAQGLRVFASKDQVNQDKITHCIYTNGTNIAKAQWGSMISTGVFTVHKPCRECGTGFKFSDDITPETIKSALTCIAPDWAYERDRQAVKKYRDWDEYMKDSFYAKYWVEV